jgi:CDP-diacylglycerol--serine O-phosphatidyltransferase
MTNIFAPFEPDGDEPRRRRFKPIPVRVLLPNMITLLSLCLGLTGIRMALEGRFELAIGCVVVAAVLDGLDGRVARLLQSSSRFGAELDSLADFVCFGVVPGIILYQWGLFELKNLGWIATLIFAMCAALRLARFNVMLDDPNRPEWQKNFFTGMAAPAGAITSLLPIYLHFLGVPIGAAVAPLVLVYVFGLAFLTISTVPTYSGKTMGKHVPRQWVLPIFLATVFAFGLLVSFPFEVLAVGTVLFLGHIPVAVARYRKLDREHRGRAAPPPEAEPAPEPEHPPTI